MSPPSQNLRGKVALITGASAGIGRTISLALAREEVKCSLAARRAEGLRQTARQITPLGSEALEIPTDVTQEGQLKNLVEKTASHWGRIDFLINNAGIFHRGAVEELQGDSVWLTLSTNLVAPMLLTKYCLPHLKKNPGSAVINIASIAGTMGFAKGSVYSASKHGLIGFTESLFEEVREDGIKVCAICPGFVNTPMVTGTNLHHEKMIPAEDVAQVILDVLKLPPKSCPIRIILRPQYSPY